MSRAIRAVVSRTLRNTPTGQHSWIIELSEFHCGEHGKDDDIEFAKMSITNYIIDRPWVLDDDVLSLFSAENESLRLRLRGRSLVPFQTLVSALKS